MGGQCGAPVRPTACGLDSCSPLFATLSVFGVFFRQGSVERALEDINTATWEIRLIFPFRIFILE